MIDIRSTLLRRYAHMQKKFLDVQEEAQRVVLNRVVHDTDKYVPYFFGELAASVKVNVDASGIAYTAPYASYANNPVAPSGKIKNYYIGVHPLATGNWMEVSTEANSDDWTELFARTLVILASKEP